MRIIDANLLIYAFDSKSPFHERARSWLESIYVTDDLIGLPHIVLLAFVRISTNPRAMIRPATIGESFSFIEIMRSHPKTVIIECGPNHWQKFHEISLRSGVFGPSMTDAYIATLAIERGATLCSNDEGFRRYVDLRFENPIAA